MAKAKAKPKAKPTAAPKPPSITPLLAKARDASGRDATTRALDHLLAAWRLVPAAAIADAITAISAPVIASAKHPLGKTPGARAAAWVSAARQDDSAAYRALLVATVTETKGNAETLARLELLVARGPDPRVSAKIGDLIERPIYNASVSRTTAFWNRIFELLPELGDPRLLSRAARWPAAWASNTELNPPEIERLARRLGKAMPLLVEAYGAAPPVLAAADAELCAQIIGIAAVLPKPAIDTVDGEELLAAIYAAPDDDEARLVYADWLQEHDDPHGELITLQIAKARGAATKPQLAREKELVATYWKAILGTLASKVKRTGARLERGFLVACAPVASTLDDDPAWATVRELEGAVPGDTCHVPALRTLTNISDAHIRQLATLKTPLGVVELAHEDDPGFHVAGAADTAFRAITVLKLRRLSIDGFIPAEMTLDDYAWTWTAPACAALEELELALQLRQAGMFLDALDATSIARVTLWGSCGPGNEYGTNSRYSWAVLASRGATGVLSEIALVAPRGEPRDAATYGAEPLLALAAFAPSRMTSLRVLVPKPLRKTFARHMLPRLEAELARFPHVGDWRPA